MICFVWERGGGGALQLQLPAGCWHMPPHPRLCVDLSWEASLGGRLAAFHKCSCSHWSGLHVDGDGPARPGAQVASTLSGVMSALRMEELREDQKEALRMAAAARGLKLPPQLSALALV